VGIRDSLARFDLAQCARQYRALVGNSSLALMYSFQTIYVICAFGSGAYASALLISRGYGAQDLEIAFAVVGGAFILGSVASGETLGKVSHDAKQLIAGAAVLFCLARGWIYFVSFPFPVILGLFAVASVCDAAIGVAIRADVATYEVQDRSLSMVFFGACDSIGQASGGIIAGALLAAGGFRAIGELAFVVGVVAACLPLLSRRLVRSTYATNGVAMSQTSAALYRSSDKSS
jgi:predicted MFS family arabinose efflux permease